MGMKILYLAKDPDEGTRSDLAQCAGHDVTVVACIGGYLEYYQTLGYNVLTLDEFFAATGVNFDIILGNPPYGDGKHKAKTSSLWKKFLEQSFELATDTVSLVIPASFTSPTKLFGSYKKHLKKLDLTVKEHFKGVGSSFCRIVLTKKEQETCEIVTPDGTYNINLSEWDCIPQTINDELLSLVGKYFGESTGKWRVSYEYDQRKPYIKDKGSIKILHSTQFLWTDTDHPNNYKIRVHCTITNGTKFSVAMPGVGLSQNNIWTECDTEEEAKALVDKLHHPEVQQLLKAFQYSNMNYVQNINKLNLL